MGAEMVYLSNDLTKHDIEYRHKRLVRSGVIDAYLCPESQAKLNSAREAYRRGHATLTEQEIDSLRREACDNFKQQNEAKVTTISLESRI